MSAIVNRQERERVAFSRDICQEEEEEEATLFTFYCEENGFFPAGE